MNDTAKENPNPLSRHEIAKAVKDLRRVITRHSTLTIFSPLFLSLDLHFYERNEMSARTGRTSLAYVTDGKAIHYLNSPEYRNIRTLIFVTLHEELHILYGHLFRMRNRDPFIWNIACDHVANRDILTIDDPVLTLPEGAIYIPEVEHLFEKPSAETVYDYIIENKEMFDLKVRTVKIRALSGDPGEGGKTGEGEGESFHSGEHEDDTTVVGSFKEIEITIAGKKYHSAHDLEIRSPKEMRDRNDIEKKARNMTRAIWQRMKGNISGNFASAIDNILRIEKPWNEYLENALLFPVQGGQKRRWTTPNIFLRKLVHLPGKTIRKEQNKKIAVLAFDWSGSMSNDTIRKLCGCILSSIKYFKELRILKHDTDLDEIQTVTTINEDMLKKDLGKSNKRGGTSHKQVFDKIEEWFVEGDDISSIILCTDGMSDLEGLGPEKYSFLRHHEPIILLSGDWKNDKVFIPNCKYQRIDIDRNVSD